MDEYPEEFVELTEEEHWEAWERGEMRCPYCVGADERDFEAMCDCSRISWERYGKPIVFMVRGRPDTAQIVKPNAFVGGPGAG